MSTQMAGLSFERIQIDGFRGLRGLDLDGLGRVNILIGANDSGKTSVLEALSVLCEPGNPGEWLEMIGRRDFGELDEHIRDSLRWCFYQSSGLSDPDTLFAGRCRFECQGRFPLRDLSVTYNEFMDPGLAGITSTTLDAAGTGEMLRQSTRVAKLIYEVIWGDNSSDAPIFGSALPEKRPLLRFFWGDYTNRRESECEQSPWASLPSESLVPYSHQINSLQVSSLSQQIVRDEADKGLSMLQGFDPDVLSVNVLSLRGKRPAIYIQHRRLGWAPLSIFGDAMRRCVLLAATLPRLKDGGVLLIDEVETGIHVKALGRVFQWLIESARQLNVQVFVTTHSLEALDAIILAPSAQEGDVVAFQLSRTDESTVAKRFAGDLLKRLRQQRGLDLR